MGYLENDQQPLQWWLEGVASLLDRPENPEYELKVMIVPAICKLVEATLPPLLHGYIPAAHF